MTVPSQVGSVTEIKSSAGSGSQSVTVPSGATLLLVLTAWWQTGVPDYTTLSLNGVSFTANKVVENASDSYEETNIYYLKSPTTGTFSWAISTSEGAHIFLVFLKDTDATTPIRASNYGQSNGDPVTGSFSSSTNDLIVGVGCGYGATSADAGVSGQTEIYDGGNYNSAYGVLGTKAGVSGTTTFTVDFTGSGMSNSVCAVSIAGTSGLTATVNQISETDTAQAITRRKIKTTGQVTETDLAQTIGRIKRLAVAQISETDLAQAINRQKARAVAQVNETDLAQTITFLGTKIIAVLQVNETDAAQTITIRKIVTAGQVTETDLAQAINKIKYLAVAQISETDTAQAITGRKAVTIAQVSETDLAQVISRIKQLAVAQISETDLAQAITGRKIVAITQVNETDLAQALTGRKIHAVAQVQETDTPQSITRLTGILVQQVEETDLAQAFFPRKLVLVSQTVEIDLAQPIGQFLIRSVGQAFETDLAQVITLLGAIAAISIDATVTPVSRLGLIVGINADVFDASAGDVSIDARSVTRIDVNAQEDL